MNAYGYDNKAARLVYDYVTIELYKVAILLFPRLVSGSFRLNNMTVYNTRNIYTFYFRPACRVLDGAESLSHLGPKTWKIVPNDM